MSPPTEAHLDLALQIAEAFAQSGNLAAARLIADSEARAVDHTWRAERDELRAQVFNLEAEVATLTAERDQLRAELANQTVRFHDEIVRRQGTVRANQELDLKELNHFRDLFDAERARLDWLESDAGMDWQWNDTMYGIVSRAAIDEAMKEEAK